MLLPIFDQGRRWYRHILHLRRQFDRGPDFLSDPKMVVLVVDVASHHCGVWKGEGVGKGPRTKSP